MDIQPVVQVQSDDEGQRAQTAFTAFLNSFVDDKGEKVYLKGIAELQNPERNTLNVRFDHVTTYSAILASAIELQLYRFYPFLCDAIRNLVIEQCEDDSMHNRLRRKQYYLGIVNLKKKHRVRHLQSDKIGRLLRISGQVVRTHPVHPELHTGTFVCEDCGLTISNVAQDFKYTQPMKCASAQCQNRTRFMLDVHDSQFVDFQRLRIQETQEELPLGCIPRNVEVIVHGEAVETAQPGDHCDFIGTLIVVPDVAMLAMPGVRAQAKSRTRGKDDAMMEGLTGLKSLGVRDLTYKMAFFATSICSSNPTFGGIDFTHEEMSASELWQGLPSSDQERLKTMSEDAQIVDHLCDGLFPNIFANKEVKLGILLMLFGGVAKRTEGTTLRGDINILMVGDPSCGKSQFLKTIEKFSPRVIYTSGKASSAAGLTAAVMKDDESSDFVIEAGALMLADNGICCIDEFDKMDPKDQVAIHEAMEQQTISITKAGVKATLNARCSILAASNPIGGRYVRNRSLRQNVELTAPILSRFDLIFIMIDENNPVSRLVLEQYKAADYAVAKRILDNHLTASEHVHCESVYSIEEIRKYIMFARCFRPQISEEAMKELKTSYIRLRMKDDGTAIASARSTVRQLESLIRLSEAYARLKCECDVTVEHVKQAFKLLDQSIIRTTGDDINLEDEAEDDDLIAAQCGGGAPVLGDITNQANGGAGDNTAAVDGVDAEKDDVGAKALNIDPAKLKITYENYKRLTNILVVHMRTEEERHPEEEDWGGIKQSVLVEWYLEQIESDLENEDDYNVQKVIVERLIHRLVKDDLVLIQIEQSEDPRLMVHPNYVPDQE